MRNWVFLIRMRNKEKVRVLLNGITHGKNKEAQKLSACAAARKEAVEYFKFLYMRYGDANLVTQRTSMYL